MTTDPDALPLEGLPPPLLVAYPSRLTTWLDCPRRYRFSYVDRPPPPKGPPWAHNSFGATVHNALKTWATSPLVHRTVEAASRLIDLHWITDGYRDEAQQRTQRERARAMTTAYVAQLDPEDEPVGVERTVSAKLPGLALSGRVDRIDRRGDELVVVDYKTGRAPLTADDARGSLQLAMYAVAAERTLRRTCRTVELHHLPTGEMHTWRHTDESLARHVARASAIAQEARAATEHPPQPGSMCRWCDFVRACPEGRAAVGSIPEPWAALGET
jgi:RecB family exonuclease